MCYPCSHCGACKVKLDPGACPVCGEPVEPGEVVCPACGFPLPVPPGMVAPKPPTGERAASAGAGAPREERTKAHG